MSNGGCLDIHTLHAELIHRAREIIFQLHYKNGLLDATVEQLGAKQNLQFVLENYFSQVGIPVYHETPTGDVNCLNLDFNTAHEFVPNSLQVILGGDRLIGDQGNPNRQFVEKTNHKGFVLILNTSSYLGLRKPPSNFESLEVDYDRRITFNTKGGT